MDWKDELRAFRQEKDKYFAGVNSPIPPRERAAFRGLLYYDLDDRYRFEVELTPSGSETIAMPRTGGDQVLYERLGTFTLPMPDGAVTIVAYRTGHDRSGELFIPFKDATSGTETYGAGRYLEVEPVEDLRYLVDFNRAYHPFCVYNEDYSCPLPPRENWLKVPVRAGERL